MADEDQKVSAPIKSGLMAEAPEVVEGEVISENSEDSNKSEGSENSEISEKLEKSDQSDVGDVDMVMKLEGMIKNNNSQIAKIAADLTEAREMLKDAFENDATYHEHADAAKDANKIKAATKAQILKQPQVAQIATNVKVLTSELKELKEALSDYLGEYNRLSGITEIEGEDGELLQIVYVAKLVRKRN